jgi:kynureninase
MRFGFAPLYIRYQDVQEAVEHLKQILENEEWNQETFLQKATVT